MDIEAEKKQLEKLKEVINLLSVTKEIEFHQQDVIKKNMHFTGANGSLWIHPTLKGYDVGLSGISLTKEMYTFMCDLSGKKVMINMVFRHRKPNQNGKLIVLIA